MRILFIMALYNFLNVIRAQFYIINEDIGDLHLYAEVGNLPLKYIPLSDQDQHASEKAGDIVDFIQLAPNIDPLVIPMIQTFSIDLPFFLLSGKIYLENLALAGIKQLQLNNLELRLINLRSDINITLPQIHVEGDFNVRATLSFMPLMLSCHISAYLYDVGLVVAAGGYKAQSPVVGEVLQIDSAAVNVDIRSIVFNLTNLVMGEELKDVDNSSATQLFESRNSISSNDNILNGLLKKALDMANKELFKVSMKVFMEYLMSDTY